MQSSLFNLGTPCQIDVKLAKVEGRKNATVKDRDGSTYKAPVFTVSSWICKEFKVIVFLQFRMVRMCEVK